MISINLTDSVSKVNFSMVQNDALKKVFKFTENNADSVFTGSTVVLKLANSFGSPALFTITGTILGNEISFSFTGTHTATAGSFVFDIQETNGSTVRTLAKGYMIVEKDVQP